MLFLVGRKIHLAVWQQNEEEWEIFDLRAGLLKKRHTFLGGTIVAKSSQPTNQQQNESHLRLTNRNSLTWPKEIPSNLTPKETEANQQENTVIKKKKFNCLQQKYFKKVKSKNSMAIAFLLLWKHSRSHQ